MQWYQIANMVCLVAMAVVIWMYHLSLLNQQGVIKRKTELIDHLTGQLTRKHEQVGELTASRLEWEKQEATYKDKMDHDIVAIALYEKRKSLLETSLEEANKELMKAQGAVQSQHQQIMMLRDSQNSLARKHAELKTKVSAFDELRKQWEKNELAYIDQQDKLKTRLAQVSSHLVSSEEAREQWIKDRKVLTRQITELTFSNKQLLNELQERDARFKLELSKIPDDEKLTLYKKRLAKARAQLSDYEKVMSAKVEMIENENDELREQHQKLIQQASGHGSLISSLRNRIADLEAEKVAS